MSAFTGNFENASTESGEIREEADIAGEKNANIFPLRRSHGNSTALVTEIPGAVKYVEHFPI